MLCWLQLGAASALLELGCGVGAFAEEILARFPGTTRYDGVDISPGAVVLGRRGFADNPVVQFGVSDMR